jgi:hypothetical protein
VFVAVTFTTTNEPSSEVCRVYVDDVAPLIDEHDVSAGDVQSFH